MKGIAHFVAGLTVASCFPQAVQAALEDRPLYFLLGGVFGLLPDTLDFRFGRFFSRHDIEVAPDPARPDERLIADAVAQAVNTAFAQGRPVRIKLDTVRVGADRWQRYAVTFDPVGRKVAVTRGPVVDTGGRPLDSDARAGEPPRAEAGLLCPVALSYYAETTIDAFSGPEFRMVPQADGRVRVEFIPWHRTWSHSLLLGGVLAGLAGWVWGWAAGAVVLGAFLAHLLVDQLGFMGSALFFPFSRERVEGMGLVKSGDAFANFATVWTCCVLLFWNLFRVAPFPPYRLSLIRMLFWGVCLPLGALKALALTTRSYRRRSARPASP